MMRRRVLIVDDDACVGDLSEELLSGESYGMLKAYSGKERCFLWRRSDRIWCCWTAC